VNDPYRTLGVAPTSSIEEVEARYRLLLRENHPDMHFAEGPEAVAHYEQVTRALNEAMAAVRAGWHSRSSAPRPDSESATGTAPGAPTDEPSAWWNATPGFAAGRDTGPSGPWTTAGTSAGTGGPFNTHSERDWFGNPIHHEPDEPVPCPYCGAGFTRLSAFEAHLANDHSVRKQTQERVPRRSPVRKFMQSLRYVPTGILTFATIVSFFVLPLLVTLVVALFLALVLYVQGSRRYEQTWWWQQD
jgi:hypothetical protein